MLSWACQLVFFSWAHTFWFCDKNVTNEIRIFFFITFTTGENTIIFVNFDTSDTTSFSDFTRNPQSLLTGTSGVYTTRNGYIDVGDEMCSWQLWDIGDGLGHFGHFDLLFLHNVTSASATSTYGLNFYVKMIARIRRIF